MPFKLVHDTYRALRTLAKQEREPEWEVRKRSWELLVGSNTGSAPFWRHGWRVRFRHEFEDGDWTTIHGFDLIAKWVREEVPEFGWGEWGDECEELLELLREPHNCLPPVEETWEQGFEMTVAPADERPAREPEPWDAALAAAWENESF